MTYTIDNKKVPRYEVINFMLENGEDRAQADKKLKEIEEFAERSRTNYIEFTLTGYKETKIRISRF